VEYDTERHRLLRLLHSPKELMDIDYVDDAKTRRYLINPGSVGQPRDGDPRACFAIIDTTQKRLSIRRVSYDVAAAQRKIREAGLPAFLADRLAIGR
jgi:diadenosine tetraphosphatase ApaH/serine/threonine PP2A family protein phosphatase